MNLKSNASPTEKLEAKPSQPWVRVVICVQCLAVVILGAVVLAVSGVLDDVDTRGNTESQLASTVHPETAQEISEVAKQESPPPITESALTQVTVEPPQTAEASSEKPSAKPQVGTEPAKTKEVAAKSKPKAQSASPSTKQALSPKPENPLNRLPKTLDILSTLKSREEMDVGPLEMPAHVRLDIEMHGGATAQVVKILEDADEPPDGDRSAGLGLAANKNDDRTKYKGISTFRLKETFDSKASTFWTVDLTDYRGTVAKIWLADGQLRFQWTENSGVNKESGYLANCVLLISIPEWGRVHSLPLRKPIQAKPATIDFVRGSATSEYAIPFMPPDVTLTVEAVGGTKQLPKATIGMDPWLTTDRDFTYLKFGDGAPLLVKVLASTQYTDKQPRIITASYFSLPQVAENISGTLSQLGSYRNRTERTIQQLQKQAASSKNRREIDREIRAYQSQMQRIKWLEGVAKTTKNSPGILFRIIHSAGDHTLDLVHGGF